MGTKETKLEEYKNLWDEFEDLLKKDNLNLSSFSKKWEKYHSNDDTDTDYKKFYNKIKKQKYQLGALKNAPQTETINQINDYIKFLDDGYFNQELLDDEGISSWFD